MKALKTHYLNMYKPILFLSFLFIFVSCKKNSDPFQDSTVQTGDRNGNGISVDSGMTKRLDRYPVDNATDFINPNLKKDPDLAKKPFQIVTATSDKQFWVPHSLFISNYNVEWDQSRNRVFVSGKALWNEPYYQSAGEINFVLAGLWNPDAGVADLVLVENESMGLKSYEEVKGRLFCVGVNHEGVCESTIAEIFVRVNKVYIFSGQVQKIINHNHQSESEESININHHKEHDIEQDEDSGNDESITVNLRKKEKSLKKNRGNSSSQNESERKSHVLSQEDSNKKAQHRELIRDSLPEALKELKKRKTEYQRQETMGNADPSPSGDNKESNAPQESTAPQNPSVNQTNNSNSPNSSSNNLNEGSPKKNEFNESVNNNDTEDLVIAGGTNDPSELFSQEDIPTRNDEISLKSTEEPVIPIRPQLPQTPNKNLAPPPVMVPPSQLPKTQPFEPFKDEELESTLNEFSLDTSNSEGDTKDQEISLSIEQDNLIPIPLNKPNFKKFDENIDSPNSIEENKIPIPGVKPKLNPNIQNSLSENTETIPQSIPVPGVKPTVPSTKWDSLSGNHGLDSVSFNRLNLEHVKRQDSKTGSSVRGGKLIGTYIPFQSVGRTNNGYLKNGSNLLNMITNIENLGVEKIFPIRAVMNGDTYHYGNYAMMEYLLRASYWLNRLRPGMVLEVNDISHKNGGYIYPHDSHRNGLDVDLGYFVKNQKRLYYGKKVAFYNGIDSNFDITLQWKFFKTMMKYYRDKIFYIFVHPRIKQAMCFEAEKNGELNKSKDPANYAIARETLRRLFPETSHAGHFHVRLRCPKEMPYKKGNTMYRSQCVDEVGDLAAVTGCFNLR